LSAREQDLEVKRIALTSIFSALYAIGVITLAPVSFLIFQVRVADALIPFSIVFGMPAIMGVTIGNVIANLYGGFGYIDVIGGSLANFIAAYVGWKIGSMDFRGSIFIATIAQNLIISSIVGFYLSFLFSVPLEVGFLGILLGSMVSMNILGYTLTFLIRKYVIDKL
jgi:uncharacterized membrane protein